MPINELEVHPFLDSIDDQAFGPNYFEGLIIGSFPVYAVTNSIHPNDGVEERFIAEQANLKFFYGSNRNSFWRLISDVFESPNPAIDFPGNQRVQQAIDLLVRNKLLISDSLFKTNREETDAQDSALYKFSADQFVNQNKSLNLGIVDLLQRNPGIKYLYFTSSVLIGSSPFGWFRQIFGDRLTLGFQFAVDGRPVSSDLLIDGREFQVFFLPSPAGNGSRGLQFTDNNRTRIFVNYIQSVDPLFYQQIVGIPKILRTAAQKARLTQLRNAFLLESWRQAFVEKNVGFDGGI